MKGNAKIGLVTTRGEKRFSPFPVHIGAKLSPECPIKTHAEASYSLRSALGILANDLHNIDINGNEHRNDKFIVGVGTRKLLGLSFTRINTRNN